MDNMDDSENNAKISDSAYSNSCSNSHSRRSHSSKSTHSGSNSSGSSGYGGKPSTSGDSNISNQPPKKDKESKKKNVKAVETPCHKSTGLPAPVPVVLVTPKEEPHNPTEHTSTEMVCREKVLEVTVTSTAEAGNAKKEDPDPQKRSEGVNYVLSRPSSTFSSDGFSCVVSMHDGIVMYTTSSLTGTLGYPKEMWVGRSFIEFVHPKDCATFASQITNVLAVPKFENAQTAPSSTMICRIRRYRSLGVSFAVQESVITFMPFMLKFTFKNVSDEAEKTTYLVIQATPYYSAFRVPYEVVKNPIPFVIRHDARGILDYIDIEAVPYLGYHPQDVRDKDALQLYHPDDLPYLRQVYKTIVREGSVPRSKTYRMMTQNGDCIKLETEWSSFINPWSMKLEFVIGKHHIIQGPSNPDVFQSPEFSKPYMVKEEDNIRTQALRESIITAMTEVPTKPATVAKEQMSRRCHDLASFVEILKVDTPKVEEEIKLEMQEQDINYERDSVMLGGISPHHDHDSKSSVDTSVSYNQLNYNVNLQRYFDSQQSDNTEHDDKMADDNALLLQVNHTYPDPNLGLLPDGQSSTELIDAGSRESFASLAASSPYRVVSKLTESVLNKHNAEMEKELVRIHRKSLKGSSKGERVKNEKRQKKKEHLARCNASFQSSAGPTKIEPQQQQGVKRGSEHQDTDTKAHAHKRSCCSTRQLLHFQTTPSAPQYSSCTSTAAVANPWQSNAHDDLMLCVGMYQHIPVMPTIPGIQATSSVHGLPGMSSMQKISVQELPTQGMHVQEIFAQEMPIEELPVQGMPVEGTSVQQMPVPRLPIQGVPLQRMPEQSMHKQGMLMQGLSVTEMPVQRLPTIPRIPTMSAGQGMSESCMMYGPYVPMYGQQVLHSPFNQAHYPLHYDTKKCYHTLQPFSLSDKNYEEACKTILPFTPSKFAAAWREKRQARSSGTRSDQLSGGSSTKALKRSPYAPNMSTSQSGNSKNTRNSDDNIEKTDGESSYSSFYSSFFKTESGSAEDSGDQKKPNGSNDENGTDLIVEKELESKPARRTLDTPWMEHSKPVTHDIGLNQVGPKPPPHYDIIRRTHVNAKQEGSEVAVSSDLIYKYKIQTKSMEEVLNADKQKIRAMEQPVIVNEQLEQLYLDLQLEGLSSRLTLDEGITSSSSSGDDSSKRTKAKRKREYTKLTMIYEEDAPMPSPPPVAVENATAISVEGPTDLISNITNLSTIEPQPSSSFCDPQQLTSDLEIL